MTAPDANNCSIDTKLDCGFIFHSVFLDCDIGLIVVDSDSRVVNWNPWLSKHSGIDVKTIIGRALIDIFPVLQKSSSAFVSFKLLMSVPQLVVKNN